MASLIEDYLLNLKQELRLPVTQKLRVLAEVSDHLYEAISHEQAQGYAGEEAERRVLQRFGPSKNIAHGFLLDAATSKTYLAGKALLATEMLLVVFSFLRGRVQPPGPWPHDILPSHLAFFVNCATLAFLCAFCTSLFACWQLWLYRTHPSLSERSLLVILSATLFTVLTLLIDAACYSIFTFQRAAVVPHSPPLPVLWLFALLEIAFVLIGSCFVLRALGRYIAFRKIQAL